MTDDARRESIRDDMLRFVSGWFRDSSQGLNASAAEELKHLQRTIKEAKNDN